MTATEWRAEHPGMKGNIRDYAAIEQLVVLSNLESINSVFINQGLPQSKRLRQLNAVAISQMRVLAGGAGLKRLEARETQAVYCVV
jgi:hypothetical protein